MYVTECLGIIRIMYLIPPDTFAVNITPIPRTTCEVIYFIYDGTDTGNYTALIITADTGPNALSEYI